MSNKTIALAAALAAFIVGNAVAASLSLDGEWKLSYRNQQDGGEWKTIPGRVPGDTHIDLERSGLIPDPMVGTNVFGIYQWEQCEWRYATAFPKIEAANGEKIQLRFDGVDTRAEYFLNGERLGASANMFIPVTFDVTGRLKDANTLVVNIKSPLRDPNKPLGVLGRTRVGGTDVEGIRKAQHMYGWDIMPRLVSSGIWKSVTLETVPSIRFGDVHWMTRAVDRKMKTANVYVDCRILAPWKHLHRSRLRITLVRNGKIAAQKEDTVHFYQTRTPITVENADFWWPRDAGAPALYDATVEFVDDSGTVLARDDRRIGFRTVRLERRDWYSKQDPGTFRFIVNGEPIYMHGLDVTPMDALHSRDRLHQQKCLDMLVDLNCNMIRVWGGGVYEDDSYYDFCDANGIMVWQDFMVANVEPEQNDDFAKTIYDEAREVVFRLRSHPCLALWCGNNEIDRSVRAIWGEFAPDPEGERISREIFPRVLRDFDPLTPYLPSSPWWTPDVIAGKAKLSQDHLWGARAKFFKDDYWCNNTPSFVSEMGCHGCPSVDSLKRMMTAGCVHPWPQKGRPCLFNVEWNCKATCSYIDQCPVEDITFERNMLMPMQVRNFFGAVPDDLETFSDMSQIYQAEADKYYIELYRSRKGRMWGELIWNLRDGWPILSDGIVDYWFGKKLAYEAIKSVHQPQLATVVDKGRLVAVNDRLYPVEGHVRATDADSGRVLHDSDVSVPANGTCVLNPALELVDERGCIRVDYVFEGASRVNRCLYGVPPFDYAKVKRWRGE